MSDYFTRLAERAIGTAETIHPRVPSRFEEAVHDTGKMLPAEQEDELTAETARVGKQPDSSSEDYAHQNVSKPVTPAPHRVKDPAHYFDKSIKQAIVPTTIVTSEHSEPQRESMTLQPVLPGTGKPELKPRAMIKPLQSARDGHDMKKDVATQDKLRVERRNNGAYTVQPEKALPTAQVSRPNETGVLATPQSLPESTQIKQPVVQSMKAQRSSQLNSDQATVVLRPTKRQQYDLGKMRTESAFESKTAALQEPTIKVSIGRVEVRAIIEPPKPSSRSRKPVKSAISLDDYLKRHEGRQ